MQNGRSPLIGVMSIHYTPGFPFLSCGRDMSIWRDRGFGMPYVPSDKIRLWFGLVLGGSVSVFWAVWTFATTFGLLPNAWNRFGALGFVADLVLIVGFAVFGVWALAKGNSIRTTNPTARNWSDLPDAKTR